MCEYGCSCNPYCGCVCHNEEKRDAVANDSERAGAVETDPCGAAMLERGNSRIDLRNVHNNRVADQELDSAPAVAPIQSAPESPEQFFERTMASKTTSRAPVDHFIRKNMFEFASRYASASNAALQQELADAAKEINCAGPIAHRIRVLKTEHEAERDGLRESLRVSNELLRRLVEMSYQLDWPEDIAKAVGKLVEEIEARAALVDPAKGAKNGISG